MYKLSSGRCWSRWTRDASLKCPVGASMVAYRNVVGVAMSVDGPDELHAELLAQGCREDMCIRLVCAGGPNQAEGRWKRQTQMQRRCALAMGRISPLPRPGCAAECWGREVGWNLLGSRWHRGVIVLTGIALGGLDDRVDEDSLLCSCVGKEVGVGAASLFEQLAEDEILGRGHRKRASSALQVSWQIRRPHSGD